MGDNFAPTTHASCTRCANADNHCIGITHRPFFPQLNHIARAYQAVTRAMESNESPEAIGALNGYFVRLNLAWHLTLQALHSSRNSFSVTEQMPPKRPASATTDSGNASTLDTAGLNGNLRATAALESWVDIGAAVSGTPESIFPCNQSADCPLQYLRYLTNTMPDSPNRGFIVADINHTLNRVANRHNNWPGQVGWAINQSNTGNDSGAGNDGITENLGAPNTTTTFSSSARKRAYTGDESEASKRSRVDVNEGGRDENN